MNKFRVVNGTYGQNKPKMWCSFYLHYVPSLQITPYYIYTRARMSKKLEGFSVRGLGEVIYIRARV